jgi:glucose-6-phosphate isomerase
MFPKVNPTSTNAWKELAAHYEEMKQVQLKELFAADEKRFSSYSLQFDDILFDYSKNNLNSNTKKLL